MMAGVNNNTGNLCFGVSLKALCIITLTVSFLPQIIRESTAQSSEQKDATVLIAILARNKGYSLPYFLTLLEQLEYPKIRISLWIRSDYNEDNTIEILKKWITSVDGQYHSINSVLLSSPPKRLPDETGPTHWSSARFSHVIQLKEDALNAARHMWADFIWFLDSDAFITNPATLTSLTSNGHMVSAPMLPSDGLYSNFWCGMSDAYYYLRTDDYSPTLYRKRVGCFQVPMVHSAVLVDLRKAASSNLTFVASRLEKYGGPHDDIIIFAVSANISEIPLHVCNDQVYGFIMMPLADTDELSRDQQQLTNTKLQVLVFSPPLPVSPLLSEYTSEPEKDKMGFDQIYMINLLRRPDRKERMHHCFKALGIDAVALNAVDGGLLTDKRLEQLEIHTMPAYKDPFHKRSMTMGEIGCFLSHYNIWLEMNDLGYKEVMVLEDDIQFEPYFRERINQIMSEIKSLDTEWDLIYLGRKRMADKDEPFVAGSKILVEVGYSYWTLGYLLSHRGVAKLLAAKPLQNLLPVDEFLPILFDKHPEETWKAYFPTRDLVALSAYPLLLYPTHYVGETGYVSDTEDSTIIAEPPGDAQMPREDL